MTDYPKNYPTDQTSDVFINDNVAKVVSITDLNVRILTDADSPVTVGANDGIFLLSAGLGNLTLNLPLAINNTHVLFIKRTDDNRNNWVYLNPSGSDFLLSSNGLGYASGAPYPLKILDSYILVSNGLQRWDLLPKEPFTALMYSARIESRE